MSTRKPNPITAEVVALRPAATPAPPPKKGTYLDGFNAGLRAQLDARNVALGRADAAERAARRWKLAAKAGRKA